MVIHINEQLMKYQLSEQRHRLWAEDPETAEKYTGQGFHVMLLEGNRLRFEPEGQCIPVTDRDIQKLAEANSHDIFLIADNGNIRRVFEAESGDNTLMVTGACNSNCLMCPANDNMRKNAEMLTLDSALERIRYMPEYTPHLTLTGGEPFMMKEDIFPLLRALKEHLPDTDILLLTNGRALSYEPYFKEYCNNVSPHTLIGIPIHGHDSKHHDRITRAPGSFEQTKKGIKKLIGAGFPVELRLVISKLNEEDLEEIGNLICTEFPGVYTVKFMGLEMLRNAAVNCEQVWIPYREAFLRSKTAIDHLIMRQIDVEIYNLPLCAVDQEYHTLCRKSITGYKVRYPEVCDSCMKKDACGGMFAGTYRLAAKDVIPLKTR